MLKIPCFAEQEYVPLPQKCSYLEFFWSEYEKIYTRRPPNTDTFHAEWVTQAFAKLKINLVNVTGQIHEGVY